MLTISAKSRQPTRAPWSLEKLEHRRALALGNAIDASTRNTYGSALQSYLTFCKIHKFPIRPTEDTFSFYVTYMSHHIEPRSVDSYMSGIANQLEPYFPDVRRIRKSLLVSRTMKGCKRMLGSPTKRKDALGVDDLVRAVASYPNPSYDDKLFLALLHAGFFGVHRLGELVDADSPRDRSARKTIKRASLKVSADAITYTLPGSKADALFEGNIVMFPRAVEGPAEPYDIILSYIRERDRQVFGLCPQLWLDSRGRVPTRSWFLARLHKLFDTPASSPAPNIGGHSLRSGGATWYAILGFSDDRIQALGRWSSDAFKRYIRKHPVLLQALLHARQHAPPDPH